MTQPDASPVQSYEIDSLKQQLDLMEKRPDSLTQENHNCAHLYGK